MKRGYKFPEDRQQVCPVCGKVVASKSGLVGHLSLAHNLKAGAGEIDEVIEAPSETSAISQLHRQVDKLKLEGERDKLLAGKVQNPEYPDAAQVAGLGKMTEPVKEVIQGRAFGVQPQAASQEDGILKTLEIISQVKGIFGGGNNGDNTLQILQQLGIDLKELLVNRNSPTAPQGMSVAGIPLAGASLSAPVITALLDYQGKKEQAEAEATRQQGYQTMVADFLEKVGRPEILQGISNGLAGIGSRQRQRVSANQPQSLPCPKCGGQLDINGLSVGDMVKCANPACDGEFQLLPPGQPDIASAEVSSESDAAENVVLTLKCPSCETVFRPTDLTDADPVTCPECHEPLGLLGNAKSQYFYRAREGEGDETMRGQQSTEPAIPPRRKKGKGSQDPSQLVRCAADSCQQLLDASGLAVGATLTCPSCGLEQTLTAPDEPLAPIQPQKED